MEENTNTKITPAKGNEKRLSPQQNEPSSSVRRSIQVISKSDLSQIVSSQFNSGNSSIKKVLLEANKIIKIGMAKEVALLEKQTAIQNSNEMIDNLRRNILKLQMEYEKLDQNYQNEVSLRSEITKRMETTRVIVESTAQYSNVLAKSVKQLEEDKFKLAEFYEIIICNQKDVEEKHTIVKKRVTDLHNLLMDKINEIQKKGEKLNTENSEELAKREQELTIANEKLKIVIDENETLSKSFEELKTSYLLQQENISVLKTSVNKIKSRSLIQKKLWRNKRRRFIVIKRKFREATKRLKETKSTFVQLLSSQNTLEIEKNKLKIELEAQNAAFEAERQELADSKEILKKTLDLKETKANELEFINAELNKKIYEFETKIKKWSEQTEKEKEVHENYLQLLNENQTLKETNSELNKQNYEKTQLILDFESKLSMYDNDFKSRKSLFKNEIQKYEGLVKSLEGKVNKSEEELSSERVEKENLLAECDKRKEEMKSMSERVIHLETLMSEKMSEIETIYAEREENLSLINKLKSQVEDLKNSAFLKDEKLANLNDDYRKIVSRNEQLTETINIEKENFETLKKELEKCKTQITELGNVNRELDEKLNAEYSCKQILISEKNQLNEIVGDMKKTLLDKQKIIDEIQQKRSQLENEIKTLKKLMEENSALKTSNTDLKSHLEAAETRIEALKVVIKKLENDKIECKESQYQEICKLKNELASLQGSMRKEKELQRINTSKYDEEQFDRESELKGIRKLWEKVKESASSPHRKHDDKENEPNSIDVVKSEQGLTTPKHNNKKFLSTPRKLLTSTPQPRLQNLTPVKRKDPYEFDSDGSVERLDPDQVLKAFRSRSKKESGSKKQKTKSFI